MSKNIQVVARVMGLLSCVVMNEVYPSPIWWVLIGVNVILLAFWLLPHPQAFDSRPGEKEEIGERE